MKKILFSITILSAFFLSSCIKNDPILYQDSKVEFDGAVWNANSVGVTYPIITRVPAQGTATSTAQPAITRTSGSFNLRVNLVGPQKSTPTNFTYTVDAASTAVAGTHYTAFSGTGTIPADSSFGIITVNVLNPGVSSSTPAVLVLKLTDNDTYKASVNYAKVGLSISQL